MSRKAKVSAEDKKQWSRPRIDIASLGYSHWKVPGDFLVKNTLVFIEHQKNDDRSSNEESHFVARRMRSTTRSILINPASTNASATHK